MTKGVLCCVSILALMAASAPVRAAEQGAKDRPIVRGAASKSSRTGGDCEARMRKLEASDAEGEERLNEKHAVIDICDRQYRSDKTIDRLVNECEKYDEQPVVKQQIVAECELAAYNYANILRALKSEYRK